MEITGVYSSKQTQNKTISTAFSCQKLSLPVKYDISDEITSSTMRVSAGAAIVVDKGIILSDNLINR